MADQLVASPQTTSQGLLNQLLLRLANQDGRTVPAEANHPVVLDDPAFAYVVYVGGIDIFAAGLSDGQQSTPRRHLMRLSPGQVMLGMDSPPELELLAVGLPNTEIIQVPLDRLLGAADVAEWRPVIAGMLADWIAALSSSLPAGAAPSGVRLLDSGADVTLDDGEAADARKGVLWVTAESEAIRFSGWENITSLPRPLPVTAATWISVTGQTRVTAVDTAALLPEDTLKPALRAFHRLALDVIGRHVVLEGTAQLDRLRTRIEKDESALEDAVVEIGSLLRTESEPDTVHAAGQTPLLAACRRVASATGFELDGQADFDSAQSIYDIAHLGNFRVRQVTLTGDWWHQDNGPLLAFRGDGSPVALVPASPSSYVLEDATGNSTPVNAGGADTLSGEAFVFYRPFPAGPVNVRDMLRFGLSGRRRDLLTIVAMGLGGGLLALAPPLCAQFIFDNVVPDKHYPQLVLIGVFLVTVAAAIALAGVVRAFALLRLEGKMDNTLQAAVWDRLLQLSVPFFRDFSAGDLGQRAMAINTIRQMLSGAVANAALAATFSLFNLILIFYYDPLLGLVATLLIAVAISVTVLTGRRQLRYQEQSAEVEGRISALVLQVLNGIAKFRLVGGEERAFALWARRFTEQRRIALHNRAIQNRVLAFNAVFPVVSLMVIFGVLGATNGGDLTAGRFVAFNTAFTQLLVNSVALSGALITALGVIPIYNRARPILQAEPEVDESRAAPGELTGAIEASHVTFRYGPEGPPVLDDVTVHVRPGEFVAIVGPSGSGKSTLLRLLLGFDRPESGSVYYDGKDLSSLDVRQVRSQIGTVLQNGRVMTGLLLQNIIGTSLLTVDDAWDAAHLAGLEDDIKRMPMGMFTIVSENGSTFSGGQRQRLLIAQALVRKPRIIFFDEATSSLDNATQAVVSHSMDELKAARVVIAHRLSTIVKADHIYVMQSGRIVQSGTYDELMAQPGLFADLAKRQIA